MQLGIVGPEDSTDLSTAKPTLNAESVTPGNVTIGFDKSISLAQQETTDAADLVGGVRVQRIEA